MAVSMLSAVLMVLLSALAADARETPSTSQRSLIAEVGLDAFTHDTIRCDPTVLGSVAACFDSNIPAAYITDYPMGAPEIAWPTDGSPWGMHITGPYPDGVTYLLTWLTGLPTVGPIKLKPDVSAKTAIAALMAANGTEMMFTGKVINYLRNYTNAAFANYSYLSPRINHVVLSQLQPKTKYTYRVSNDNGNLTATNYNFTTLGNSMATTYPLRIGLIADVGQTKNSSATRDHLMADKPDVIILTADNTYADDYSAKDPNLFNYDGTNQLRWDSAAVMFQNAFSSVPVLNCAGNHELEQSGVAADVNYTTTSFSWPTDFPFQTYTNRWPVPGSTLDTLGNITKNLYYSTVIGGVATLITLNNYSPFHPGTPQYAWAVAAFKAVNRTATPWLIVQFHAPPYHTYYTHYKEQECFMSFYEDIFYKYGVDIVLNGHVHAYERTHPVHKYKLDTCAPIYITIGDSGNIEGPYRNFVDEINPQTNKTYCEQLNYNGLTPNQLQVSNPSGWGPSYQTQAHPPNCTTLSWQPSYSVTAQPPLVPLMNSTNLGFCQSSQPLWSAHRDPSFGHGMLVLLSDTVANFTWNKNLEGINSVADHVTLERLSGCAFRK